MNTKNENYSGCTESASEQQNAVECNSALRAEPAGQQDARDPNWLLSTMDGKDWADEFCRLNNASDHGMMLAWFCNAIMTGYDTGRRHEAEEQSSTAGAAKGGITCDNKISYLAAKAPAAQADYTVDDSELARKIMVFLGRATTASMEPGADPLRDRLAERLALWRPAATPASTPEAPQQAAADEPLCPACQGSGEGLMMEGEGPDAYEVPCNCPYCGGSGGLLDAYNGLVALLAAEREKYLNACGKLFHASLAPQQAAAVAAPSENDIQLIIQQAIVKYTRGAEHETAARAAAKSIMGLYAAPATAVAATTSEDARDAARWRKALMYVGAVPAFTTQKFILDALPVDPEVNLLRGSVAGHFTKAIDAAMRAIQQEGGK